ncbi:MAG TPA: hypothetical protein VLT47_10655 [Anaeromyxobacteraceae bacterium]|nr:hypothetical protein [Anaeromyxobacteraceae bacterium]
MTLRRYAPLALAALALACTKVKQETPSGTLVFATFDSTQGIIPTPNDLALQGAPAIDTTGPNAVKTAQKDLLLDFVTSNGFPSDQEVSISIPFKTLTFNASTSTYDVAASQATVDPATATPSTVALYEVSGGAVTPVAFTAETDALDAKVLKLRKAPDASGSRRWKAGARYVVAVRGGASGVKTTTGLPVNADQAIALLIPNKDMTKKENQPPGGLDAATAAKLDGLRKLLWNAVPWCNMPVIPPAYAALLSPGWNPVADPALAALCSAPPVVTASSAFAAAALAFPVEETAAIATFQIAPSPGTYVVVDSGSGVAPLPFDLMREAIPSDTTKPLDTGLIKPNAAFGAAGAGLVTLDGFSTTAMILAQTSGPITAGSVAANVKLYKRESCTDATQTACTWSEVVALAKQPSQIQLGGFSVAIGLQPAVWAGTFPLPPLAEDTKYAVVVTNGVTDATGMVGLARSTFSKLILEQTAPVVYPWPVTQGTNPATLVPLLAGMDAQTAAGIQKMRDEVKTLIADRGLASASIATAYTFKTQSITGASVGLSAAPYSAENGLGAAIFTPTAAAEIDPLTTFGIPAASFPNVAAFVGGTTNTLFAVDLATGALKPDSATWVPKEIPVLVAVPQSGLTTPCTPVASPLVVLHHGINGSRLTLLPLADRLAQAGFVVAAIDAPYHGARSYCNDDADCGGGAGACQPVVAGATLAAVPGTCASGTLNEASASGNYFISSNFFRTRDAIRQDLIDQSGLVLALARPPTPWPQPAANPISSALAARCVAVDPTKVYFLGVSLGGMIGTNIAATNPRVSRAVLDVAGGTLVDVFTNAPAFASEVDALFLSLGIDRSQISTNPAVAAAYLKTVNVAKWILDPADPINFAAGVATKYASPIAPILGALASSSTSALGQASFGDAVVPNAFNDLLYTLALPGGTPPPTTAWATYVNTTAGSNGVVPHGVIGDTFTGTLGGQVRTDAADFLLNLTIPTDDDLGTPGIQVNLP